MGFDFDDDEYDDGSPDSAASRDYDMEPGDDGWIGSSYEDDDDDDD